MRPSSVTLALVAALLLFGFRCPVESPRGVGAPASASSASSGAGGAGGVEVGVGGATTVTVGVGAFGGGSPGGAPPIALTCSDVCGNDNLCLVACQNQADACPVHEAVVDCYATHDGVLAATSCVLEECPELAWAEVCRVTCGRLNASMCLADGVAIPNCTSECVERCGAGDRVEVISCALQNTGMGICAPGPLDLCIANEGKCVGCASEWGKSPPSTCTLTM